METVKPAARLKDYKLRMFELPPANAAWDAKPREVRASTVKAKNRDDAHRKAAEVVRTMKREARVIQNQGGGGDTLVVYLWHPTAKHPDMRRLRGFQAPRDTTLTPAQRRRR